MESEKVKEIKEKLQEEIFIANSFDDKLRKVPTKELENLQALINELESENKRQKQANKKVINIIFSNNEENQQLKDRIAELEKENKDYYDRLNNLQTYIDNHEEIWKVNTKTQLKQFAERLKIECVNKIHETLKEFINEHG